MQDKARPQVGLHHLVESFSLKVSFDCIAPIQIGFIFAGQSRRLKTAVQLR